jgi:hypothetical protein
VPYHDGVSSWSSGNYGPYGQQSLGKCLARLSLFAVLHPSWQLDIGGLTCFSLISDRCAQHKLAVCCSSGQAAWPWSSPPSDSRPTSSRTSHFIHESRAGLLVGRTGTLVF